MLPAVTFALSGMFGPAWMAKLIGAAAVVAAVLAGYLVWHHHVWQKGWDAHALAIATQDAKAVNATKQLLDTVRSCRTRGLRFNQLTLKCDGG